MNHFLDYCATHPNAGVRFVASDMLLCLHSDASYLSEYGAKSRAGGHFFLGKKGDRQFNNGAIHTLSSIIKCVVASASEAELQALFLACRAALPLRVALEEMGHPQLPSPATTDNTTAHGLTTSKITPKAMKTMNMRMHWLRSRAAQGEFNFLWDRGERNRADFRTKDHTARHCQERRSDYVVDIPPQ